MTLEKAKRRCRPRPGLVDKAELKMLKLSTGMSVLILGR